MTAQWSPLYQSNYLKFCNRQVSKMPSLAVVEPATSIQPRRRPICSLQMVRMTANQREHALARVFEHPVAVELATTN
jgi:hypothetical protein